jgi:glycosyltransferase involved in cell wall biosynthesis
MTPRLGVLDFNPIQYHAPLYQRLSMRGNVHLDVLYLSNHGYSPVFDPGFGATISWNIDLLSNYNHKFLSSNGKRGCSQFLTLTRWIRKQDAVVIHGYTHPWMLAAIVICRTLRIPYLLRGDSQPNSQAPGAQRALRHAIASSAVRGSSACLSIGQLNESFYRKYGAKNTIFAPYSVDDERFAKAPTTGRSELLAACGLSDNAPVIIFCGKLYAGKRPLDLVSAVRLLTQDVSVIFIGDGVLANTIRASIEPGMGVVTGFVNQSELPAYYHAADILVLPSEAEKWGLVVNEAMAAGVVPVVSDRVGAAPDLVQGIGEIYPCGDIKSLAAALGRTLTRIKDPRTRDIVQRHAERYSLAQTVLGFEAAAAASATPSCPRPTDTPSVAAGGSGSRSLQS